MNCKILFASVFLSVLVLCGCTDKWDDYYKGDKSAVGSDVMTSLKSNSDYSDFVKLLEDNGIDDLISSSKIYTVWAPTNAALSDYASLIPTEASEIKTFLKNHFCYDMITYQDHTDSVTVKMASGKNMMVNYSKKTIDAIAIADTQDAVVSNGVIHEINKPITLRSTIWDIIKGMDYDEVDFLNSLTYVGFNADSATATGIDAETGETVYDTASGMVTMNTYLREIADLSNEDSMLTFFIMDDASYAAEMLKFGKYYEKGVEARTDSMTQLHIVSDLTINSKIAKNNLNGSQLSVTGTTVPVSASNVTASYQASNGMVYVIGNYSLPVADRIKEFFIEAEYPRPDTVNFNTQSIIRAANDGGTIVTWARDYANNGFCITSPSSTYSLKYVDYYIDDVYTCKYDIYWVSVTETEAEAADTSDVKQFMQLVNFTLDDDGNEIDEVVFTSDTIIPTYTNNIVQQYVGQFEVDTLDASVSFTSTVKGSTSFDNYIRVRVQGVNGTKTPIYLDYFRLVPIIE